MAITKRTQSVNITYPIGKPAGQYVTELQLDTNFKTCKGIFIPAPAKLDADIHTRTFDVGIQHNSMTIIDNVPVHALVSCPPQGMSDRSRKVDFDINKAQTKVLVVLPAALGSPLYFTVVFELE